MAEFADPTYLTRNAIDVSDASCDTLAEVIDTINGNCTGCSSDFRAVLIDGLRTDSSNDTLLTFSAAQATRTDGYPMYFDTDVALFDSRALIPNRTNIAGFLGGPPNYKLLENPFAMDGLRPYLQWYEAKSTYGSGTSLMTIGKLKMSEIRCRVADFTLARMS